MKYERIKFPNKVRQFKINGGDYNKTTTRLQQDYNKTITRLQQDYNKTITRLQQDYSKKNNRT